MARGWSLVFTVAACSVWSAVATAMGAPPVLITTKVTPVYVVFTFAGYDTQGTYQVEISRYLTVNSDGHFQVPPTQYEAWSAVTPFRVARPD